jgi:pyruvate formate lyase activating enzyme
MQANIFNIQKMSTEDGPGIRTTVFMKGCPLRCAWCQNPEGLTPDHIIYHDAEKCIGCGACKNFSGAERVKNCPAGALHAIGRYYSPEELMRVVLADRAFYEDSGGGVTFSGGECLIQHRFLSAVIPPLRAGKIHVAIDTSGFAGPEVFSAVAKMCDLVLFDLKLISDREHRRYTGQSNAPILENARILGKMPVPVWIRVPVIPGITDSLENISGIGRFVRENMGNVARVDLLGYNDLCRGDYEKLGMDYPLGDTPRVSREVMERLRSVMEEAGIGPVTASNYEGE